MPMLAQAVSTDLLLRLSTARERGIYLLPMPDPPEETADLKRAMGMLEHAVEYLVEEQLHSLNSRPDHEAIVILCKIVHEASRIERRKPPRSAVATWLSGASLFRATSDQTEIADW